MHNVAIYPYDRRRKEMPDNACNRFYAPAGDCCYTPRAFYAALDESEKKKDDFFLDKLRIVYVMIAARSPVC